MESRFVAKTREGLIISPAEEALIASRGFDIAENDNKPERCILVIGLNPAGNEDDAERERKSGHIYYYSLESKTRINSKWIYKNYYSPIWDFSKGVFGNNIKWPWCNQPWRSLEAELKNDNELADHIQEFKNQFDMSQNQNYCTIYIGDMFYYHSTDSKEIFYHIRNKGDEQSYCLDMLTMHINELRKHNKDVEFVYINNAQVSHWLCGETAKTKMIVNNTPVYLGSMLSGQRSMDLFSRQRLIEEIRKDLMERLTV